jgi:hypothetical protein
MDGSKVIFRFFLLSESHRKVPEKPFRCVHASRKFDRTAFTASFDAAHFQNMNQCCCNPLANAVATPALQQFIRNGLRVDGDEIRGVAARVTVIAGVGYLDTHPTNRCTIDLAQCATRAGKFLIKD